MMQRNNNNTTMGSRRAFRDVTNAKSNDENVMHGTKKNSKGGAGLSKSTHLKIVDDNLNMPVKIARTQSSYQFQDKEQQNQQPFCDVTNNNVAVNEISNGVKSMMPQPFSSVVFAPESASNSLPEEDFSYQYTGHVDDIDAHEVDNPLYVTDYVQDMYQHFRQQEIEKQVNPNYMLKQSYINSKMRGILVDWLVEVHLRFKLVPETLYLCVSLIDRFLSKREVTRSKLQLVGVTCMFIASKYE